MRKKITEYLKNLHFRIDRNIISYGICVIIAAVLWFLNALNKEYTSEISYPVKYTDFPKGKYLVSELPQNITLEVRAKGFSLLGYHISTSFLPIVFNVNTYSNHLLEKNNVFSYTLRLNDIKDKISNQLSSDIKLLDIEPEEINFRFSEAESKLVAIKPEVKYTLKPQYILRNNIRCIPDSISVSGPALIIDTLNFIPTEIWNAGEISRDISKNIRLKPLQGIYFEETEVQVTIEIERYTEGKRTIRIRPIHLPDSLGIRLFPETVEVTYDVGLSKYDQINDSDFSFVVDYRKDPASSFLQVKAARYPDYIKDLDWTPQKVEYILEKNK